MSVQFSPEGHFVLASGDDFAAFRYAGLPLGSVGRRKSDGAVHGHLSTLFAHADDYDLLWLNPSVKIAQPAVRR